MVLFTMGLFLFFFLKMIVVIWAPTIGKLHYADAGLEIALGNPYLKFFHFSLVLSASLFLLPGHFMNATYRFH